jgi:hypothetical protein
MDAQSVSTDGPVEMSSAYSSYQAALDAAAGGILYINDTKREEAITYDQTHDGTTIIGVGDNWVQKPSNPTDGEATFRVADGTSGTVRNMTWIGVQVENPDLVDGDILTNDAQPGSDWRRPAWERGPPNSTNVTCALEDCVWINCKVNRVQGHGFALDQAERARVVNCTARRTAFDGFYQKRSGGDIKFIGCDSIWAGRHNFTSATQPAEEDSVHMIGCYGEDAYLAGVDMEDGRHLHLDVTVKNTSRKQNTGFGTNSGLNVNANSEKVTGTIRVINPNVRVATILGRCEDLTIISHRDDDGTQIPTDVPGVDIQGASGSLNVDLEHACGATEASVNFGGVSDWRVEGVIRESQGQSVSAYESQNCRIDVTSINPCLNASNLDGAGTSHVELDDGGANACEDWHISILASDANGNAENGVAGSGGDTSYIVVEGSLRNAYTNNATVGLSTNSSTYEANLIT